jgi:hypothetical protein
MNKFTDLKEMLTSTVVNNQVVMYGLRADDPAYKEVAAWLSKLGYQVEHTAQGYQLKPTDTLISFDENAPASYATINFDLFNRNSDSQSLAETFSFCWANQWQRKAYMDDCSTHSDVYKYLAMAFPEATDLFTPERSELVDMGLTDSNPDGIIPFVLITDKIRTAVQSGKAIFLYNLKESCQEYSFWRLHRALEFLTGTLAMDRIFYVSNAIHTVNQLEMECAALNDQARLQCLLVVDHNNPDTQPHAVKNSAYYTLLSEVNNGS